MRTCTSPTRITSTSTRVGRARSPTAIRIRRARWSTSTRTLRTSTTITVTPDALYSRRATTHRRREIHVNDQKARLGIVLAPFAALPAAEFVAVARETEARGYHM